MYYVCGWRLNGTAIVYFLQAGPLEKVAIPPNKTIAFVTFKHSVSAPYAKELFRDTRLHGQMLNISFRTGSIHSGGGQGQRQSRAPDHSAGNSRSDRHHGGERSHGSPYQRVQGHNSSVGHQSPAVHYNGSPNVYPSPGYGMVQVPFFPDARSMPAIGIQGYRSSAENREYVPQYVSFENPPVGFRGGVPINHPDHPVAMDERRQRLLNQQHYLTEADMQRNQRQGGYGGRRR